MMTKMKTIPGFPDYAISKDGRIWSSLRGGSWLSPYNQGANYLQVSLKKRDKTIPVLIHRLVLETYVGLCPEGMQCRHLDGNPANNHLGNLCWGTPKENQIDSKQHGTLVQGEKVKTGKLTKEKVQVIRYLRNAAKFSLKDIAWQFDVSMATICEICTGKTWKHLETTLLVV